MTSEERRYALTMPDLTHDELNWRIAVFDGWEVHITGFGGVNWFKKAESWRGSPPDYCSDDSERSLLAGVERKLAGKWRYLYECRLLNSRPPETDLHTSVTSIYFWLITAPAVARCRAICAVLDEMQSAEVQQ